MQPLGSGRWMSQPARVVVSSFPKVVWGGATAFPQMPLLCLVLWTFKYASFHPGRSSLALTSPLNEHLTTPRKPVLWLGRCGTSLDKPKNETAQVVKKLRAPGQNTVDVCPARHSLQGAVTPSASCAARESGLGWHVQHWPPRRPEPVAPERPRSSTFSPSLQMRRFYFSSLKPFPAYFCQGGLSKIKALGRPVVRAAPSPMSGARQPRSRVEGSIRAGEEFKPTCSSQRPGSGQ